MTVVIIFSAQRCAVLLCPVIDSDPSQMLNRISSRGVAEATMPCTSVQMCLQTFLVKLMAKFLLLLEVESGRNCVQMADTSIKQTNPEEVQYFSRLWSLGVTYGLV